MSKLVKLLVIDDDEADRLHLKRALKTCGFEYALTECDDAANIAGKLLEDCFDCIFLDYLLPGENGLLLLKKIRDNGIKTPIVIITSQGNESIAVELMKAGASDYVVKNDITGQSLRQVLRNMLRMSEIVREREEAEKALRVSEARLAEAQRIAKTGNWEYDIASDSMYWSSQLYQMFGLHHKDTPISVSGFFNFVHAEDKALVESAMNNALQGNSFNIDFRINPKEGGVKYVHGQGYGLQTNGGPAEKIIGTLQDITERKLSEQEILKARELAENSMKVREIFLANMSHEIRTPMNAILGFTRLLYETDLSKEQKSFIDAIHFSGENLLVIINDILDLSKIQSGKMTIEKCEFNIYELVTGIISVLRPKASEKGLHITSKIHPQIPVILKGDPVRLNQVLTNLITNAIKFTEKGGVTVEVNSIAAEKEILIEFRVKDTGIGIPEEKQSVIFDNFVQASSDTTRKYGGTGLGLAIVKNLVELQEGKISITSEMGQGSTFVVHLPFEKVNQESVQLPSASLPVNESLELLRGAELLVVEDNAVNQLLVKKVLDKTGCKIDIASSGVEAITCIKAKKYDVILMDVQMPEMDGYEATRHIRTKLPAPMRDTPIIAMTAHAFGSDVTECMAAGMNDYLSKPFKQQDLYAKIIKYLQKGIHAKVVSLTQGQNTARYKIDLSAMYELGSSNPGFLNELILLFDRQTPEFTEKLRGYIKSQNFEAIKSICQQIKSSYGILRMTELDKALDELLTTLDAGKSEADMEKMTTLVNGVIALISAINEEVKRGLRKTGS